MGVPWWSKWLGFCAFSAVAQVQSLAWKLRSRIKLLHAVAKRKKKEKTKPQT